MRSRAIALLLGAIVLLGGGFILGAVVFNGGDKKKARTTHVVRVSPFGSGGGLRPGYDVAGSRQGSCDLASEIVQGAFRCFVGNSIYDGCWRDDRDESGQRVVCLSSPTSKHGLAVDVPHALRSPPATGHLPAWVVVPAGGKPCVFITGAGSTAGDKRVNYQCPNGHDLLGMPARYADQQWRISSATLHGRKYTPTGRTVAIETAYFGTYRR